MEVHKYKGDVVKIVETAYAPLNVNREISLRELIYNAIDAVRIRGDSEDDSLDMDHAIRVVLDLRNRVVSVEDTGVGFTKAQLVEGLGTVGASGTQTYVHQRSSGSKLTPLPLFGRLGLGFYSAFPVSRMIKVVTKSCNDEQYVWKWESGSNEYSVECDNEFLCGRLNRGTQVHCFLKDDATELLQERRLEPVLELHAHRIKTPIVLVTKRSYG